MRHQKVTRMVLAAMFAAITAVASQIIFPLGFTPVPFSCAMFAIYLCGALLDPRTAFFSQLAYLLAGAAGACVAEGAVARVADASAAAGVAGTPEAAVPTAAEACVAGASTR